MEYDIGKDVGKIQADIQNIVAVLDKVTKDISFLRKLIDQNAAEINTMKEKQNVK